MATAGRPEGPAQKGGPNGPIINLFSHANAIIMTMQFHNTIKLKPQDHQSVLIICQLRGSFKISRSTSKSQVRQRPLHVHWDKWELSWLRLLGFYACTDQTAAGLVEMGQIINNAEAKGLSLMKCRWKEDNAILMSWLKIIDSVTLRTVSESMHSIRCSILPLTRY